MLLVLSIPIVVDSQNQGLMWGFDASKKLCFKDTQIRIHNSTTIASLTFNIYIITRNNYTIPDPLTYFPLAREEPFFYNDTPAMTGPLAYAVPIGNWGLLETVFLSLSSSYYDSIITLDDVTTWGFQTTKNRTDGIETRKSIFSKTDGIWLSALYELALDFGYTSREILERVTPPFEINSPIIVARGSIIFIGLLVVYFFRRLMARKTEYQRT